VIASDAQLASRKRPDTIGISGISIAKRVTTLTCFDSKDNRQYYEPGHDRVDQYLLFPGEPAVILGGILQPLSLKPLDVRLRYGVETTFRNDFSDSCAQVRLRFRLRVARSLSVIFGCGLRFCLSEGFRWRGC